MQVSGPGLIKELFAQPKWSRLHGK